MNRTDLEAGTTLFATLTTDTVCAVPVQPPVEVPLLVVNTKYVTIPTVFEPLVPDSVAVSKAELRAMMTLDDRLVVIDGVAVLTVITSQVLVAGKLFASPLYVALKPNVPA